MLISFSLQETALSCSCSSSVPPLDRKLHAAYWVSNVTRKIVKVWEESSSTKMSTKKVLFSCHLLFLRINLKSSTSVATLILKEVPLNIWNILPRNSQPKLNLGLVLLVWVVREMGDDLTNFSSYCFFLVKAY